MASYVENFDEDLLKVTSVFEFVRLEINFY